MLHTMEGERREGIRDWTAFLGISLCRQNLVGHITPFEIMAYLRDN